MKAMMLYAPRDIRLVEVPRPEPSPVEVLIRIESTGICGSDIHYYVDGRIGDCVIQSPLVLGHEYAGIVEKVGALANPTLVGKRVAVEPGIPCLTCESCRSGHYNVCPDLRFPGLPPNHGAFAEYITVHGDFCFPVPETVSAPEAALIEPLAVAVHTIELARLRPGETVAVLGLGPIGLLTSAVAKLCGASVVYGTDLLPYRLKEAAKYGVDVALHAEEEDILNVILKSTAGRGVDVALDCARSSVTPAVACKLVRPAGRVVLTGISGRPTGEFPVDLARRKELTLTWCRRFLFNYPAAIYLVSTGKIDVASLITHRFPLCRLAEAFEMVASYADSVLKVSIDQP